MKQCWRNAIASAVFSIVMAGNVQAAPYTGLTFFGDSISDTGNVLALTTLFQPPPFPNFPAAPGRFSNGSVWAEYLAAGLGLPSASLPSHLIFNGRAVVPIGDLGGQNFSFGGARTGLGGSAGATTGLLGQLLAWNDGPFSTVTRAADPDALYVVSGGSNDMRDFRSGVSGARNPRRAAANVVDVVERLAQAGAEHFLIPNLADLGLTPEAMALGLGPESTAASLAFNAALLSRLDLLDARFLRATGIDLDLRVFDVFTAFNDIHNDALNNGGVIYGIMNVTTPCIAPVAPGLYFYPGSVDVNCSVSAFSDPLHPSAAVHRIMGELALLQFETVPEPETLSLLICCALSMLLLPGIGVRTVARRSRTADMHV